MLAKRGLLAVAFVGLAAIMALAACARGQATPTPTPTPTPPPATVSPIEMGKTVYAANCAACHGPEAQGSAFAPPLPGHSAKAIERQVRSPMGTIMPAFSPSQFSDEQLEALVAYIGSLPVTEMHAEPLEMAELVVFHHWMGIFALKEDNVQDALHHIDHIIAGVTDPEHKHAMEEAKGMIAAGNIHDAEHEVEEMLAGKAQPEMGMAQLHLQLAQSAMALKDAVVARHHIEHFIDVASAAEKTKGEEVLRLIQMGDMHKAEEMMEQMMGMMPRQH